MRIQELFAKAFNGQPNFMTPDFIEYGRTGGFVWEISTGRGMSGQPIYGVTVLDADGAHRTDLGGLFQSLDEAKTHAEALEEEE